MNQRDYGTVVQILHIRHYSEEMVMRWQADLL